MMIRAHSAHATMKRRRGQKKTWQSDYNDAVHHNKHDTINQQANLDRAQCQSLSLCHRILYRLITK